MNPGAQVPMRSWFGDGVLLVFCLAQLADGALTYIGVNRFGLPEGNPVLGWYFAVFGAGLTLVGAKAFAILCATALYFRAMHRTVGILAILYLAMAVLPWSRMLWP